MTHMQHGGLLLIKQLPSTFHAIYDMIKNAKDIQPLYMHSLKGFLFVLHIDSEKSLFYTLNPNKRAIDVKVDSVIFKFAFVGMVE